MFMGYIDDADGNTFGRFYPYEGTFPAMDSFKRYARKYGIPVSLYLDKHSTYKSTAKPSIADTLSNTKPLSEFERAMKEFGVKVIHADPPQAKGRVERLFRTQQDRLVKEMRLEKQFPIIHPSPSRVYCTMRCKPIGCRVKHTPRASIINVHQRFQLTRLSLFAAKFKKFWKISEFAKT